MPAIEGFGAWIEVEGLLLQEFSVDALEDKMGVTCWVPCEIGKNFSIGVAIPEYELEETSHKVRVRLDGVDALLPGNIFQRRTPAPARRFSDQWVDAARSGTRAFQFGVLELTDNDDYLDQSNEHLGEIEVAVQSVEEFIPVVPKEGGRFNDESRIHEQSQGALPICVKFGEAKTHHGAPPKNFVARGVRDVFTFVFKYRSMDVLIANDIAPRIPGSLGPGGLDASHRKLFRKKRKTCVCGHQEVPQDPPLPSKRLKKAHRAKRTHEKAQKRVRKTPSWTDDSDHEPDGSAGRSFRILPPSLQ